MKKWALSFLVMLMVALSACSGKASAGGLDVISIQGKFGAPVTMSMESTPEFDDVTSRVVSVGDGPIVEAGGPLLVRATSFNSLTGIPVSEYDTGNVRLTTADKNGIGDIASALVGATEGSRILVARPNLTENAAEIVVVDILYTSAHGTAAELPAGFPQVVTDDQGILAISGGVSSIPDVVVEPVIETTGPQVTVDDVVVVQYTMTDSAGTILTTTWADAQPVALTLDGVMTGLRDGIVDQHVGSRVVILIPSADAAGDGDRIAVVDILAVLDTAA